MDAEAGTLYIVATPIGNLEDITLRALGILKTADIIAAEDTRVTQKLLTRHGISGKLTSYHDHNKEFKAPVLVEKLGEGQSVALVSDAGTPLIADPGYYLVNLAQQDGVTSVPIPGACAVPTALSVSGLPTDMHLFLGYLPNRTAARQSRLQEVADLPYTVVAYESPHRLLKSLADVVKVLGERQVVVCRELTKQHEEIARGTASELIAHFADEKKGTIRGEITLVIAGIPRREARKRAREVAKTERKRQRHEAKPK